MEKSDLGPGDMVRNTRSDKLGWVRGLPDGTLGFANGYVSICRYIASGKNIGMLDYPIWCVTHLKLVKKNGSKK